MIVTVLADASVFQAKKVKSPDHARLAVNSAKTLADLLFNSLSYQKEATSKKLK